MATVDNLDILIKAQADSASRSIERLVNMFDQMRVAVASLSGVGGGLDGTASAIQRFVMATKGIENINKADFTRLKGSINAVGKIDSASIKNASEAINKLVTAFSSLNGIKVSDSVTQVVKLAEGIKQLGYKSAGKAIENIPKLADAMADLMHKLSGLPLVSQNLIDMTNALAKLARTGGASGTAANSLAKSLGTYTNSLHRASKGTFSLASAIGKLYATYWLLFRAFRVLGKAIDISSQLTEVQNVVDVTFGEYSNLIEKISETSITDFGMSELTVKQVASRFQAMGSAMGISQQQVADASEYLAKKGVEAYGDLGDSMADMSVNLTKLTADMASFYNVEQSDVAEDLQSIFTGQTRPLRQYGLDLTEATLKEWAMKQGLDANISAMTQAEKTMLRYQYVMANTGSAQGDFQRTAGTWANQVRILKMNLEELGSVVGGTLINAFKPLVTALNYVMGKLIAFAKIVSESLGAIFGWEFQSSGSGGVANDFDDLAGSADDLASGTGSASDNLGSAANNAKKLKDYLLGIDELNVIAPDDSSSGGGSGGSGGGTGGLGGGSATDTGGQWTKTESLWEKYESDLDTLFELGAKIGGTLKDAMLSIDWDKVYEGAKNFGTGLADFLNGLISPELFGATGTTIANSLNTAIYAVLATGKTFDFEGFGVALGTGLNKIFSDFDFVALSETLNTWVDGLEDAVGKAIQTFEFDKALSSLYNGLTTLEFDTIAVIIGAIVLKRTNPLKLLKDALIAKVGTIALELPSLEVIIGSLSMSMGTPAFDVIGSWIVDGIGDVVNSLLPSGLVEAISSIGGGAVLGALAGSWIPGAGQIAGAIIGAIIGAFDGIKINGKTLWNAMWDSTSDNQLMNEVKEIWKNVAKSFKEKDWASVGMNIVMGIIGGFINAIAYIISPLVDFSIWLYNKICELFGIHSPAEKMKPIGKYILLGIKEGFSGAFAKWIESISKFVKETKDSLSKKWGDFKFKISSTVDDFKKKVSEKWNDVLEYWEDKDILEEIKTTYEDIKAKIKEQWEKALQYWGVKKKLEQIKTTYEDFKAKVKEKWDKVVIFWNSKDKLAQVKTTYESFKDKISELWNKAVDWWNKYAKLPKLNIDFDFSTTSIRNAINNIVGWINKYIIGELNKISITIGPFKDLFGNVWFEAKRIGFNLKPISAFEDGGFPKRADLFWANENGVPELVGTMGGKTAVASGNEITGISDAVYATGEREASLLADAVMYLREIASKEMSVNIGDKEIARSNNRGQRSMGMKLITEM